MTKANPIDTTRARLKAITQEIESLDREREILSRFLSEYETFATESLFRTPGTMPSPRRRRLAVPTIAAEILKREGHPLTARELVARLAKRGKTIGGKDPVTNLSSVLSPNEKFVSVRWGGIRGWWLADREVPPEPVGSGGEGADVSASASQRATTDGGTHAAA